MFARYIVEDLVRKVFDGLQDFRLNVSQDYFL
jgi:hypothetical protein